MRNCPICKAVVDGLSCPQCGHNERRETNGGKSDGRHRTIVVHGREIGVNLCDFVVRGEPCNDVAVWSLHGYGEGPWYCRKHSLSSTEITPDERESGRAVLRQLVARAADHFRPREPGED